MDFFPCKTFQRRATQIANDKIFLGDIFVIHSWIQTIQTTTDFAANREMRFSRSLSAGLCVNFENLKYQPTLGGSDRPETKD